MVLPPLPSNKRVVSSMATGNPSLDSTNPSANSAAGTVSKKHKASASTAVTASAAANSSDGKSPPGSTGAAAAVVRSTGNSSRSSASKKKLLKPRTLTQILERNCVIPYCFQQRPNWKRFIKRCQKHPEEVKVAPLSNGDTVLHSVLTQSFEVIKAAWEAYPWAMEQKNTAHGHTPLFGVVSHNTHKMGDDYRKNMISLEVFEFLIRANTGSTFTDQLESNPYGIPRSVFENHIMPMVFPTHVLSQKDRAHNTMLHIIVSKNQMAQRPYLQRLLQIATKEHLLETTKLNGETPLYIACRTAAPVEIITDLLDVTSEAAQIRTRHGYLPLHKVCACKTKEENKYLPLVEPLIHAYSDALYERLTVSIQGRHPTPLDLARSHGGPKNKIVALIQHHITRLEDAATTTTAAAAATTNINA